MRFFLGITGASGAPYAARVLAGLTAAAALVTAALPEREPYPDVFASFEGLLRALDSAADWPARYVGWERDLLAGLGFGLDLGRCAVSGVTTDLAYVSPRTGRAVSRAAGLPYRDKLLVLPGFLWCDEPADRRQIESGMKLTGHFLVHHVFVPQGRTLPAPRSRLAERMRRAAAAGTQLAFYIVIPAKSGDPGQRFRQSAWTPACAGVTDSS